MSEGRLYRKSFNFFNKVINQYQLLENGEKVLIGVSGGVDSMVLTDLFNVYNLRRHKNWGLLAVHIDPGFPKWNTQRLTRFFDSIKINYLISKIDVPKKLAQIAKAGGRLKSCFFCSRE
jgi:tRNA(Ile)-lysidine synthase TilS/MesJ